MSTLIKFPSIAYVETSLFDFEWLPFTGTIHMLITFDSILDEFHFMSISVKFDVISFLSSAGGTSTLWSLVRLGCLFFGRYLCKTVEWKCLQIMHAFLSLGVFAMRSCDTGK